MTNSIYRNIAILVLRVVMVSLLIGGAWQMYRHLPPAQLDDNVAGTATTLQIVIRQSPDSQLSNLDVVVDLYPVDIVAVRHEFFTEPRAGKRFEDFLKERMKGRSPVTARLDPQGRGTAILTTGNWWLHAKVTGDEELEWRLPVSVVGTRQLVELTTQNAYTRSKSF